MGIGIKGSGYIEKISLKQAKALINAIKSSGGKLQKGEQFEIMYDDGHIEYFDETKDMSKASTVMMSGVGYKTAGSIGIAGQGFKLVGHNEDSKPLAEKVTATKLTSKNSSTDSSGNFLNQKTSDVSIGVNKEYQQKQQEKYKDKTLGKKKKSTK